jgi:hypothetical protein
MRLPDAASTARTVRREGHAHDAHPEAYPMLLDIVLLRTFVAVVEAKSFTRAAGFVNLTQSAVSLHIKRLEEQVGRRHLRQRGVPGLVFWHTPNGVKGRSRKHHVQGAIAKGMGVRTGVSDLVLLHRGHAMPWN